MAVVGWDADNTKVLTIANGQQLSDVLNLRSQGAHGKWVLGIYTDEGAFTGTITVEALPRDVDNDTPVPLHSSGVAVTVNVNSAQVIDPFPFAGLRLSSSASELADRNFRIIGFPR